MKLSWFKVPVKVEQINEYFISDTVQSQETKSGSDEISQGQRLWIWFHSESCLTVWLFLSYLSNSTTNGNATELDELLWAFEI